MEIRPSFPPPPFLKCFLCYKLYEEPTTFPCFHSFCKRCIVNLQVSQNSLKCPRCFALFKIDLKDLKPDIYLKNRIDFYKAQIIDLTDALCNFCQLNKQTKKPAVSQCVTCLDLLCKDCSGKHTSTTATIDHQVISISDVKTGEYDDKMLPVKYKALCSKHSDEELCYFCNKCVQLTCRICLTKDHKGHDVDLVSDIIDTKENITRKLCQVLRDKVFAMCKENDCMKCAKKDLNRLEEQKENEIRKICSEAVSKIDKEKNKMLKELHDHLKPKSQTLARGIEKVSGKCNNVNDAVQFAEHVLDGMNSQKIFLFDELQERLKYLEKHCQDSIPFLNPQVKVPNVDIAVTDHEQKFVMTFKETENIQPHTFTCAARISSKYVSNENSSDFLNATDKAVQTSQDDFEDFTADKDVKKRKCCLTFVKCIALSTEVDKKASYFTSVAWIDETKFAAVDAGNAKLKICSHMSGTILKSKQIIDPLAVSAWKDGISCLTKENKILIFNHDLCLQRTIRNSSCLCPSLPTSIQFGWIENATILTQMKNGVSKRLALKRFPLQSSPAYFRYACSLPNGIFALSDKCNNCVYLADDNGSIFKTLSCNPGAISFDNYYNIFIARFQNSSVKVVDLKGNNLADLDLKQRPRSISILHDKLLVAAEFGSKVFVYDITYR